jgi:hypothetical protein
MIINYFLKEKLDPDTVLHYQNVSLMLIGLYTLYTIFNPVRIGYYDMTTNIIMTAFAIIDMLFLVKKDLYVHHICILMFTFYRNYFHIRDYYGTLMITELLKTEISTIFIVFDYWIPKKYALVKTVNGIVFVITFFKFRIYDMFYSIATNQELHTHMNAIIDGRIIGYIVCYGAFYTLYALNVYWFVIIMKKMYKALFSKYESYVIAEYILQHTYDACLLICLYIYIYENPTNYQKGYSKYYVYDIIGISILTCFSFVYHASNYYSLVNEGEEFNCVKYPNVLYYIWDNFAIRLRIFTTILTNTSIRYALGHPYTALITYLVGGVNILSSSFIAGILLYLHKSQVNYTFNLNNPIAVKYSKILGAIGAAPIVMCTFLMNIGVHDLNLTVHNYMVLYLLVLVSVIQPFYKMNHVLIHVILMYETWVLCKINASF